ncbi:MAG: glycoside hydrolase family 78 protein [Candidatus Latescibacterota bacterium]
MSKWAILTIILSALAAVAGCGSKSSEVKVTNLRCEYLVNPLGIDVAKPRLSWEMESSGRGQAQKAWRVLVASSRENLDATGGDLWDSGKVKSDQSNQVVYEGKETASGAQVFWKVRVWDKSGKESAWSDPASWSMGLLSAADWQAKWIGPDRDSSPKVMPPAPYFRKSFRADKPVRKALLYVTARGLVEPSLNGGRVGKDVFAPEWTDYDKRIQYRTYDVTSLVKQGENALGIILGDGWYSGYIGWRKERGHYGLRNSLLARLEMEYEDGAKTAVISDESWKLAEGPILSSDFLMGEVYDARKEIPGWNTPGFDDAAWKPATVVDPPASPLVAQPSEPVQVDEEINAIAMNEPKPGVYVFNLGQNIAGWARLRVTGPAGTKVTLRFAERLNPDGTIYTTNLRAAKATDTYILKGGGEEVYEPHFTFHGFQYVELTGLPSKPELGMIAGCAAYSQSPVAGSFECSSPMVNQLYSNICWGQRGNFISIPTDCPQRDERLGWMGDAQIFIRSATYNRDVAAFFTKWMQDVEDAQSAEGAFADTSPRLKDIPNFEAVAAWADAGVIVPWTVWRVYGDTRIIERHWASMEKWMNLLLKDNPDLIRKNRLNNNYGDWLSTIPDAGFGQSSQRKELLATAYWAYDAKLMSQMAKALGRAEDFAKYDALFQKIRSAYQKEYVLPDGRIRGDTQTVYVLSLYFDLLPEDMRSKATDFLVEDIIKQGGHLTTGFLGVRHLCPTLTAMGHPDVAYQLLNNDTYPSWGYSIKQGATTIWERWDGWTAEKGFQDPGMNSFNHYSLGSVGEWMFESVAGIDLDPEVLAFKHSIIRPVVGGGLTHAKAEYHSIYGKIASGWKLDGENLTLDVTIPANTTATVYVPASQGAEVTEGGKPAQKADGLKFVKEENGYAVFEAGSGNYSFTSTMKR